MDPTSADDIDDTLVERLEEKAMSSASSRRGGRGGRGGGRGGGGGGRGKREVDLSKALSRLLRHQATSAGIELDREGYARLDKVVSFLLFLLLLELSCSYLFSSIENRRERGG